MTIFVATLLYIPYLMFQRPGSVSDVVAICENIEYFWTPSQYNSVPLVCLLVKRVKEMTCSEHAVTPLSSRNAVLSQQADLVQNERMAENTPFR